jgi:hypothetical protein
MKAASAAAQTLLSGGSYTKTDLYAITLTTGASYYFTGGDSPLSVAVYPSASLNNYAVGFTIEREETTQAVGLDSQDMKITWSPAYDNPGGMPLIAGYSIQQASRLGLLDGATVLYSKLFSGPTLANGQLDTSARAVAWFEGLVAEQNVVRNRLEMTLSSNLAVLNQTQMPRNLYQAICSHTVYDVGCALVKSTFTVTGTVGTVTNNSLFNTNLTQVDDYFDLGVITFTSGGNNTFSSTIKKYSHASGALQVQIPFPATVHTGDTFSIFPGCDHLQATCSAKFSNLAHFKGMPYIPVPETLYDGGTSGQVGSSINTSPVGSGPGGRILPAK